MIEIAHPDNVQMHYGHLLYTPTMYKGVQIQSVNKHDFMSEMIGRYSFRQAERLYHLACICNEWIHAHNSLVQNSINPPVGIETIDCYFNRNLMLRDTDKAIHQMIHELEEM